MKQNKQEFMEKYRDPRWQRKRLEILERDNWTCQSCYDDTKTLNVHHRYYLSDVELWDYPKQALVTLCEVCHKVEADLRFDTDEALIQVIRRHFLSAEIKDLTFAFESMNLQHLPEVVAAVYAFVISNPNMQSELIERYFDYLRKQGINTNG